MNEFETRVFRDSIHGYIRVEDELIWKLINAPEFQRLRRIHQLGGVFEVYHAAEHSRFTHSLGVYEIARRISSEIRSVSNALSVYDRRVLLCAALLHDIGHGPYSHMFEKISGIFHEDLSALIITDPESSIARILCSEGGRGLAEDVVAVLRHEYSNPIVSDLISSQLDCDRMDYLLRDAYNCAVTYGQFDLERILRIIRVKKNQVCVKESGIHAVEDYSMARYQMYWQVYLHPDAIGFEQLIIQFFRRLKQAAFQDSSIHASIWFETLLQGDLDLKDYLNMDEPWLLCGLKEAMKDQDPVLSDFADRVISRKLLGWVTVSDSEQTELIKNLVQEYGYDPEWYCIIYEESEKENLPYEEDETRSISVWSTDHSICPLSEKSAVAKALLQVKTVQEKRIYLPKELTERAHQLIQSKKG